jgi:outer membrane lipoprotein SlyB
VKRTAFVAFWAFVGAVLGFLAGTIVEGLLHRAHPGMDEAEYMMVGLLVPFVATVVGALVGGVVGARVERR